MLYDKVITLDNQRLTYLLNGMEHLGAVRNKSISSLSNKANIGSKAGAVLGLSRSLLERELSPII
jgi:hypothetical protein